MGVLTGKYDQGMPEGARMTVNENFRGRLLTEANIAKVRALQPIASDLGITRSQLALAWALRQPGVSSVITGATAVAQIEETLKAAEVTLDDATLTRIAEVMAD
jgi:aryl-alcohol dehydrogenase-like predicted oxidoreductase